MAIRQVAFAFDAIADTVTFGINHEAQTSAKGERLI
jgi:hypothetical protein